MWIAVLFLAGIMSLAPATVLAAEGDMQQPLIENQWGLEPEARATEQVKEEEEEEVEHPRIEAQQRFESEYNLDDGDSDSD